MILSISTGVISGILISDRNGKINAFKLLIINILFSIPDVVYVMIIQFAVVYLIQKHLLLRYSVSENFALLHVITLTTILAVYLAKVI